MIATYIRSQIKYIIRLLPGSPFRTMRNYLWRIVGFKIAQSANISSTATIICGDIQILDNVFIGEEVMITGGGITIESNCDIAPRVTIHAGSHQLSSTTRRAGESFLGKIHIGEGTWIGTGAIIINGANIGKGSIIAAGSVVKPGIYPENSLLAGNPAIIKKNYPPLVY